MSFTAGYKVNEGTQYEFTVSDETIQEAVQATGGITDADISDYCYTALIDNRIHRLIAASTADPINFSSAAAIRAWSHEHTPYYFGEPEAVISNTDLNGVSDTVYERNFLVWHGTIYPETENEKTGTFLVMDMVDIKRWYINYDTSMFYDTELESTSTREGGEFTGYNGTAYSYNSSAIAGNPEFRCDNNDPLLNPDTNLAVINVLVINDELWIGQLNPSNKGKNEILYAYSVYANYISPTLRGYIDNTISEQPTYYQKGTINFAGIPYVTDMNYPEISGETFTFQSYAETNNDYIIDVSGKYGGDWHVTTGGVLCKTLNALKKWMSWCGLKFQYDDTMYKPIIEQGVIVGYTDNMDTPSEYDDMTNVTGNNISPTPPGPTPPGPGPYDDDPWSGATFSGVGVGGAGAFAKCYYMTSTELANLRSWMNSNNVTEGFDPMAQIIGLSQVPVSLSGDDNTTVQFVNASAVYDPGVTRLVDSGVSTQIAMGTPIRYSLGSVDIVRRMQERGEPYLDYDCQIELYLPLIGMFSLDTQAVMGRTITAEAVLDPISGTLAAYAYVSRDGQNLPIAYGSTTIGVDLPISAQQYSVSRAALKQANAQLGASILSSTLSFIAAATAGGKGAGTGAKTATGSTNGLAAAGIREAGADYMKASQAGNVFGDFMQWGRTIRQLSYGNNTAIAGSFGGSTAQWSYPFTPYVKIIRPRYEKPSNYAHSQGVPCVQTKSVGSCTGFIQCIGVDVSGITGATDIELQAIQSALANGVYAGGGA